MEFALPWLGPLPQWSARAPIDRRRLPTVITYSELAERVVAALRRAGFDNYGFYAMADGGLAIVACTQHIQPNGFAFQSDDRCSEGGSVVQPSSSWIPSFPRPGYFRVIIFTLGPGVVPVAPGAVAVPRPGGGSVTLPGSFFHRRFRANDALQALVYVVRKSRVSGALSVIPSGISATEHIHRAGITIA